jgi:hypothetical protein
LGRSRCPEKSNLRREQRLSRPRTIATVTLATPRQRHSTNEFEEANGIHDPTRGRVLDIASGTAEPADILIEGDTIREISASGCPGPEGALDSRT